MNYKPASGKVLELKIGKVQNIKFKYDKEPISTAIRKMPVEKIFIKKSGPEGDDVGLKEHHGGIDKALFSVSVT